ncbi:MAG: type IX secretion system membrane protein PorP/SprF [Flavobacteriales bacterium]|nr:type IX secretion system membrane protein PorP/SprF [Flavobacteriales bacterium]
MRNTLPYLLLALAACIGGSMHAQQLPQLSQYVSHDYLYDPAVAGSRPWFEVKSAHRNQWVGIQDAPRTFMLSASTPVGQKMGVGGYIFTDNVGPTRRTGFQLSYAYHLKITSDIKLGLGLSFGMLQFLVDGSKIQFHEADDPLMDDQLRGSLMPDATFGAYLYHDRWWFGATAPQLLRNRIWFYDQNDQSLSKLAAHYYAMGGYRIPIGTDLKLEPSFLVKYVDPVPPKVDLTATLRYKDLLWVGATYRTEDALSFMVGYWMKQTFQFGYSYDLTTTNLQRYTSGTHEVMLGITFGKTPPTPASQSVAPTE